MLIFYADDDTEEIEFFCEALKSINSNIKCVTALNGEQALQQLKNLRPYFIFLDLHMPKLDGRECLMAIKDDPKLRDIPVIIYSSLVTEKEIQHFSRLGAYLVLNKQHNIIQLSEILKDILYQNLHNYNSNSGTAV